MTYSNMKKMIAGLLVLWCMHASFASADPIPLIISTDVAIGLDDTHGAEGYMPTASYNPQDADDGLTVVQAINLKQQGLVDILGIIPIFGNATLPAEMLVAHKLVRDIKKQPDIPIEAGAVAQYSQTLQKPPQWFDENVLSVSDAFLSACDNLGVRKMQSLIMASKTRVTILVIGPLTDVACLLSKHAVVKKKIKNIIILASQVEKVPLKIRNKVVNDFNFRMDPVAGAMLLKYSDDVKITLMPFCLTGQTSNDDPNMALCAPGHKRTSRSMRFDETTLRGPDQPTPQSEASLKWILSAIDKRNAYWKSIFGLEEGPFDQYTLMKAVYPGLFSCQSAKAYVQMCAYPAWSHHYRLPYNAETVTVRQQCIDHGATNGKALSQVAAQMLVTLDAGDQGQLVRGRFGIDGNIPTFDGAKSVTVEVCVDFKDFDQFEKSIYENTW